MEFLGQTFEKIQVEGCQAHICARPLLGVNCPLTAYYYSSRYLLYESLLFSWGARCVSISDLLILGSIGAKRRHFSANFRHFQIFHLNLHDQKSLAHLRNVENECSIT